MVACVSVEHEKLHGIQYPQRSQGKFDMMSLCLIVRFTVPIKSPIPVPGASFQLSLRHFTLDNAFQNCPS